LVPAGLVTWAHFDGKDGKTRIQPDVADPINQDGGDLLYTAEDMGAVDYNQRHHNVVRVVPAAAERVAPSQPPGRARAV
jgi:hypothetical protein